ncbi:MAG: hypothetical protein IJ025_09640 [Clostridia bacterium]|nr:hypothetical protein [Clostridia bacterium]
MARYGLDLRQKNKDPKKRNVALICVFLCFVVVLGSVSTLLLWRSLNYDFNNIFVRGDVTETKPATTENTDGQIYSGEYVFLVSVTSDDGKEALFHNLICVDLSEKTFRVVPVDGNIADSKTGMTCDGLLVNNGIKSLVSFLGSYYSTDIDRYVLLTESGYKSFFRAMGDITVKVSEDIAYDTDDMFLELNRGENILTPDKTYKYMKYICETKKGYERSKANADITVAAFNAYYTAERFNSADNTFSVIIDYCTTDITIVDFTNAKDEIEYLIPKTSKEKLKVFISDNIRSNLRVGVFEPDMV